MTASFVPVDQLEDGHTLILGTTGSGKTYQLRGMLEQLRRADRRVSRLRGNGLIEEKGGRIHCAPALMATSEDLA